MRLGLALFSLCIRRFGHKLAAPVTLTLRLVQHTQVEFYKKKYIKNLNTYVNKKLQILISSKFAKMSKE